MTPTITLPIPALSPEVLAFAAEKGVEQYLLTVAAGVRRLFPDAPIDVVVQDDPELSDNRQIVFNVAVDAGCTAEEMAAGTGKWAREVFSWCPATHVHVFCLSLEPTP